MGPTGLRRRSALASTYMAHLSYLPAVAQALLSGGGIGRLDEVRAEVQALTKFVALNYVAVVKAVKKRNRHLKVHWSRCSQAWT